MANLIPSSPLLGNDTDKGNSNFTSDMAHPKLAERKRRTRTGCLNCSRRRRKCDETKPSCTGCKRRGEDCQWRMLGSFRDANIKVLDSDHPSMSQGGAVSNNKRQNKFKIMNNLSDLPRSRGAKRNFETGPVLDLSLNLDQSDGRGLSPPSTKNNSTASASDVAAEDIQDYVAADATHTPDTNPDRVLGLSPPLSGHSQIPQDSSHECVRNGDDQENVSQTGPLEETSQGEYSNNLHCDFEPPSLHDDASSSAYLNSSPEFMIDDLTALRNITQNSQFQPSVPGSYESHSPQFNHSIFSDPADFTNDVFLPGSTYEALHTTLRNRQLWTARTDVTSLCSPRGSISHIHTPTPFSDSESFTRSGREPRRSRPGRFIDLSPEREHVLWQNYLNEICSWVSTQPGEILFRPSLIVKARYVR